MNIRYNFPYCGITYEYEEGENGNLKELSDYDSIIKQVKFIIKDVNY